MLDAAYKQLQEASVTGHRGTTTQELVVQSLVLPFSLFAHHCFYTLLHTHSRFSSQLQQQSPAVRQIVHFLLDYTCLVLPTLLIFTVCSQSNGVTVLYTLVLIDSFFAGFTKYGGRPASGTGSDASVVQYIDGKRVTVNGSTSSNNYQHKKDDSASPSSSSSSPSTHLSLLSIYRSHMMISTCIAILAVDFPSIFPRRFCKTETYGISLMDTGVGSFVLSYALTSSSARQVAKQMWQASGSGRGSSDRRQPSFNFTATLKHIAYSIGPLVLLGILRLFTIQATNYQSHVTEYGVHWNFFFTLAAVALAVAVITQINDKLMGGKSVVIQYSYALIGITLLAIHQYLLLPASSFDLTDYVMNAPRTSFISANKEGIVSILGYVAISLLGTQIGAWLLYQYQYRQNQQGLLLVQLALLDATLWALALGSDKYIQPYSRRLVNASYVLWILAYNVFVILTVHSIGLFQQLIPHNYASAKADDKNDAEVTRQKQVAKAPVNKKQTTAVASTAASQPSTALPAASLPTVPSLLQAVNTNSLAVFLAANLLTGLTNLCIRTLEATQTVAVVWMTAYTLIVCGGAWVWQLKEWKLKLR